MGLQLSGSIELDGSLSTIGAVTASAFIGDGSGLTGISGGATIDTGSFAITGSNVFIGNQTITGSLKVSGSGDFELINLKSSPSGSFPEGQLGDLAIVDGELKLHNGFRWNNLFMQPIPLSTGFGAAYSPTGSSESCELISDFNNIISVYYFGDLIVNTTVLYSNSLGTITAPSGWYSSNLNPYPWYRVNENGVIIETGNCPTPTTAPPPTTTLGPTP